MKKPTFVFVKQFSSLPHCIRPKLVYLLTNDLWYLVLKYTISCLIESDSLMQIDISFSKDF